MASCQRCHGVGRIDPPGSQKVLGPTCGACGGTGREPGGAASGTGCLKSVAGVILVLYVIFYFARSSRARENPLLIFTDTYTAIREWIMSFL